MLFLLYVVLPALVLPFVVNEYPEEPVLYEAGAGIVMLVLRTKEVEKPSADAVLMVKQKINKPNTNLFIHTLPFANLGLVAGDSISPVFTFNNYNKFKKFIYCVFSAKVLHCFIQNLAKKVVNFV